MEGASPKKRTQRFAKRKPVDPDHKQLLETLALDRPLAHQAMFEHRHPLESAPFHAQIIEAFRSPDPRVVIEAFRDAAKSTIGEEAIALNGGFQDFNNCVIVGSTETRAADRLEAIKYELENNDHILELFGNMAGDVWQTTKVVLANGRCIQALGVGQSVRGIKHHQWRPDLVWCDDIEDEESVKTPEACMTRLKWLYGTLIPACAKNARVRVTGNRLSADAVVAKLAESPKWRSMRFPICYLDPETGEEKASWPALYNMEEVIDKRDEYESLGLSEEWGREYMCEAVTATQKTFTASHYKVVAQARSWHPTYAMWDPARTGQGKRHQSAYGKAVASWIGRKLVVWAGYAKPMMPADLIDDIFATEIDYSPIVLGVEENGLEDWLKQPLRTEMLRRRMPLPNLRPIRAPKDKDGFIRAMQPYFESGEIEFATEIPEAKAQLLSFPGGKKDFLNTLAYFWRLRPGAPIYEDFTQEHVTEALEPSLRARRYLAMNADGNHVTGVLAQFVDGLEILADWVEDGDAMQCAAKILSKAQMEGGANIRIIVPPKEIDVYANKGLVGAIAHIPAESRPGRQPDKGQAVLRNLLQLRTRGMPAVMVSAEASWTLRAFSGGYARDVDSRGNLAGVPVDNIYRTLMEGLESMAGMMQHDQEEDDFERYQGRMRTGRDGQQYRSLIGTRPVRDLKIDR